MMSTLIVVAALMGQAPSAPRRTETELAAQTARLREEIQARARATAHRKTGVPVPVQVKAAQERAGLLDRRHQKAYQRALQDQARDQAARQEAAAAQAQYERMLPALLENQRQMLNRQTAAEQNMINAERNRILDKALTSRPTYTIPPWWGR